MERLIKYCFIIGVFAFMILSLSFVFGIENTLFERVYINNNYYRTFNLTTYLNNFNGIFDKFTENISELTENHYNRSGFIEALKSIGNILISIVNTLLIPFSLVGSLLNVFCAFFGLPLNDTNPIYLLFNGLSALQIPYIPV